MHFGMMANTGMSTLQLWAAMDIQMPLTFVPHLKERFLPAADPPITQAFLPVIWHCEMILLTMLPMKLAKSPTDSRWKS